MKLRTIFLVLLSVVSRSVSAQKTIKIWEGMDLSIKHKWSELTVFLPENPNPSGISVIICPGGSYYWLDIENEGFSVAKYLNKKGITAFVLKYRTAKRGNHHPAMIQDLERAIRIVKEKSGEFGIHPDKVGVMGFSAGGHLAGTAAIYAEETTKPCFAAMIYPVISMQDPICHKKSRKNLLGKNYPEEWKEKMSLEKNVNAQMPPVFLLHCVGDKTVDYQNSVVFEKALIEKNVSHKFLLLDEYRKGGHGFGIQPNGKATGWIDAFVDWVFTIKCH